ncbi:hypothetical protein U1Q18_031830, partial [Sarracenia purpurea var. burkii]
GLEEDCPVPTSASSTRPKKSSIADEEIMELPWQNGQVVVQSQDQRSLRRSHIEGAAIPANCPFDRDFYSNLIYPTSCTPVALSISTAQIPDAQTSDVRIPTPLAAATSRPPISSARYADVESSARFKNFLPFSRPSRRTEPEPSSSNKAARESTVIDSSATSAPESRLLGEAIQV